MQHVIEIREVLLPERFIRQAKCGPQCRQLFGIDPSLRIGKQRQHRIARDQARNQEIQCRGNPERAEIKEDAAEEMSHDATPQMPACSTIGESCYMQRVIDDQDRGADSGTRSHQLPMMLASEAITWESSGE